MNTLIGTIVEAGTDERGQVRLIIHTEEAELKKLAVLPLYRAAMIRIEPLKNSEGGAQ